MNSTDAIAALHALGQERRLAVFRLLVRHAPGGLTAGAIAAALIVPASTLSHHLGLLERAGLLVSRREQRQIIYAVDVVGMRALLAYLMDDCCGGRPEICDDVPAVLRGKYEAPAKTL